MTDYTPILVSQNVTVNPATGERRDSLDQRWIRFLTTCGLLPIPVPNDPATAQALIAATIAHGVLLTGGVDLAIYGGNAPERDSTEERLIRWARTRHRPLLGVCRGMQKLATHYGAKLVRTDGHAAVDHDIEIDGTIRRVNSYHHWTIDPIDLPTLFRVTARAADGGIEAITATSALIAGIMWHPERREVADPADVAIVREHLLGMACVR
ncbi:gamma-glutamyl-gamma-aminobutyrate hydrolase family protein [Nocardia puris]|uniref:gamma-glutamyl-gamma-aminobutyrate hydrolase family protein n=1 Tax=Nocardia puris TaxID=208602 RepID=UPI001894C28C|nr:gamma-glutamyl-gamma-aminobutyrate hydrolase family protein [Nocardia puris]MBF6370350.1 gamma-glutamyl-gamma-aminobutyrate hydrolase family protein [Nocardia puris]